VSRDPATAEALRQQIERLRLGERIRLLGEVDATTLQREYDAADVFVSASYLEGYGMALAEAVGHGLPIVSTAAGAVPETVSSKVGLLVPAGNDRALAEAIAKVLDEPDTRQQLVINALTARKELATWELSSRRFAAALEKPR
jgi:glycosyltransferase involved in cell wall biosynthesis